MGTAVHRNRIKRLFREAIRLGHNELTIPGKLAVVPKTGYILPKFEEIRIDLFGILAHCKG